MYAAIIELNPLPDAIRPPTENDDFLHRLGMRLTHLLVRRIQVRRMRHKFRAASIDTLKRRGDVVLLAQRPDALGRPVHLAIALGEQVALRKQGGDTGIREAILLGAQQRR